MKVVSYVSLAVCLFAGAPGYSQFSTGKAKTFEFRWRLVEGGLESYDGLVVDVANLENRTIHEHVDVMPDGSFAFRAIEEGDYQVRVLTLYGAELATTIASVGPAAMPFELRLPQARLQKPISGTVSAQQLNHPLSKQVRKLLESGDKLFDDRHYDDAAARFREAALDDPDCPRAHAALALALSRIEKWEAAVGEYRAAITLDPRNSLLHSNLSAALAVLNRFDEAGSEAAAALKLDHRNVGAHYVMASVLIRKQAPVPEVVSHLVAAQDGLPSAKAALEKICAANRVEGCP